MLWVIFAVLTAIAVMGVLWPLAKAPRGRARAELDIALYKAQLAEIDRDESRALVTPEDAQAAKAQAARRLMAVAETAIEPSPATSLTRVRLASVAVLIFVPALALGLYTMIGRPELPDAPLATRLENPPSRTDFAAAIAKIEAHLAEHPEDGRGFEVLAPVYLRMGRPEEAARAARAALRLLGETPERLILYGEALVNAAHGSVTPEAKQSFEAALEKAPSAEKPRFFLGLAAEQAGDKAGAAEFWNKLIADAPADAPWVPVLRERIAALEGVTEPRTNELAAKIEAMPDADRMSAVRSMVDGLAARLAQNGQDLEGWLRLVRSYTVLHEPGKARSALNDAKRNLASDPSAIARIDALARELGLES
jgi:cytochrome c-type biogenesis protein CcmH